jgi:RimJ/RimL family protein N-acetyltransferase
VSSAKFVCTGFSEVRRGMAEFSGMGAHREVDRVTERQVASRGVYRTQRLRLVPIDARHAPELWELHQDEGIARWYPLSKEEALRFVERMESSWRRGLGKWLAYENSTGAFVGRGGPSWTVVEGAGCVEMGWALRQELWGRGYATEIGRAGLDHAFSVPGVEEVVAFTEVHNVRSRAVMERLGMRYVRQILRSGLIAGSSEMQEDAPFALYRITRAAHDPS